MDALTIKFSSTCQTVPSVAVSSITTTSAQVSFTGTGNFIIEYGNSGFTPGVGSSPGVDGTIVNTSATTINLTGLVSAMNYDVYVRKSCGGGTFSPNSQKKSFSTDCLPLSTFPLIENFESVPSSAVPACWNAIDADASGFGWYTFYDFPAHSGMMVMTVGTNSSSNDYLVLPRMLLTGQRLKYWVKENAGYEIVLSTSGKAPQDFNTIVFSEILTSPTNDYVERKIDLSAYSGTVYIAFHTIQSPFTSISLDDITIENTPACFEPTFLKKTNSTNNSVTLNWQGTGNFIIEYGLTGFTPGIGATPGAGGTIVNTSSSTQTIGGLSPATAYDFYLRKSCVASGNGYSINSKISAKTFINCSSATAITLCSPVTANFPAGVGTMDFFGKYPYNSLGAVSEGKEVIYIFTPPSTGVYYITVTSQDFGTIDYFYKPVSGGCASTGWVGIGKFTTDNSGKRAIGMLTSGVSYYILLDNRNTDAKSQAFKVCKATVGVDNLSQCSTYSTGQVPANSTKEEFIIDNAGNLIASFDFSLVNTEVGGVSVSRYVNTAPIRRDGKNREYLDVNYDISVPIAVSTPIRARLFFTNNDLTRLINEPDDGIADVASVNDLQLSRIPGGCYSGLNGTIVGIPLLQSQTQNGNYEATGKFIQFNLSVSGQYYLHGNTSTPLESDLKACPSGTSLQFEFWDYNMQWQVDDGGGFVNLVNNSVYSGVNTNFLSIYNPPSSFAGFKYRCIGTLPGITIISNVKTIKFENIWLGSNSSDWFDIANWNCYSLPNEGTDVIINAGVPNMPVVNSNVNVRSLTIKPGATVTVTSGFKLEIKGK